MVIVGLLRVVPLACANIDVNHMRKVEGAREANAINMQIANYLKNIVVSP
jgi:hypothetical protein